MLGPKPQHALALVLAKGTQPIDMRVGTGFQHGRCLQMQVDVRLQFYGTGHEFMPSRQHHPTASFGRTAVDGPLNGRSIIGDTVAFRSKYHHVIGLCVQCQYRQQCNRQHVSSKVHYRFS